MNSKSDFSPVAKLAMVGAVLLFFVGGFFGYHALSDTTIGVTLTVNPELDNGLVGHWTFDGQDVDTKQPTGEIRDRSGDNNHGDWKNHATTTALGKIGQALEFDGVNDYIDLTTNSGLPVYNDSAPNLTIAFWVKGPSGQSQKVIYGEALNSGGASGFSIRTGTQDCCQNTTAKMYVQLSRDDFSQLLGSNSVTNTAVFDNQWHHVVYTDTDGGDGEFYIDGVRDTGATWDYTEGSVTLDNAAIAAAKPSGTPGAYFNGIVDDLRVYNRTLSSDEIQRLYNLGKTTHVDSPLATNQGLLSDPVGWWPFDAGLNTQINDSSSNNNFGYFTGGATSSAITDGNIGIGALTFDGTDDYVFTQGNTAMSDNIFSISVWIKPDDTGSGFILRYGNEFGGNADMLLHSTDEIRFWNTGGLHHNTSGADLVSGQWYHIVGIIDGSAQTVSIYVNGIAEIDQESDGFLNNNSVTGQMFIGSAAGIADTFFDGVVDDVRLYDYALSAEEVQTLYNLAAEAHSNVTLNTNPALGNGLSGYWNFDKSLNTQITDHSNNDNHGYFSNVSTSSAVTTGKLGQGVQFDGVNDFVRTGYAPNLGTGSFSVATWVNNASSSPAVASFFGARADTGLRDERVDIGFANTACAAGEVIFTIGDTDSSLGDNVCSTGTSILTDWHHAVGVFDSSGGNIHVYVDGELINSTAITGNSSGGKDFTGFPFYIGGRNDQGSASLLYEGKLDDTRFYTRALSGDEIKRLYELGR